MKEVGSPHPPHVHSCTWGREGEREAMALKNSERAGENRRGLQEEGRKEGKKVEKDTPSWEDISRDGIYFYHERERAIERGDEGKMRAEEEERGSSPL